ncbi:MAG: hypothetical protein ACLQU2_29395 [Candidatus Binataceae bacterium]
MDWLSTAALWMHVVSASWWILACVTMAVAGAVVGAESAEGQEFIARVVPRLNQANAVAAAALLLSGIVNLVVVGKHRGFSFPPSFVRVLSIKVALYVVMAAVLWVSSGIGRMPAVGAGSKGPRGTGKLAALSAMTALMGAAAMILGVWLAGD